TLRNRELDRARRHASIAMLDDVDADLFHRQPQRVRGLVVEARLFRDLDREPEQIGQAVAHPLAGDRVPESLTRGGGAHSPAPAPRRAEIFSSSRGISTGLVSKSSQPASSAFSRSPDIAWAVS